MQNEELGDSNIEVALLIGAVVLVAVLWWFDELVTYPWAALRFIESYLWTHVFFFLPDFITAPHEQLRSGLIALPSWRQLSYSDVYRTEYVLIRHTTWIYLVITMPSVIAIVKKKRPYDESKKRLNLDELIEKETVIWRYNRYLIKHNPFLYSDDVNKSVFAIRDSVLSGLKRTRTISLDRVSNSVTLNKERGIEVFSQQLKHRIDNAQDVESLPFRFRLIVCVLALREETLKDVFSNKEKAAAIRKYRNAKRAHKLLSRMIPFPFRSRMLNHFRNVMAYNAFGNYKETSLLFSKLSFNENVRYQLLGDMAYQLNGEHDIKLVAKLVDHILPQVLSNDMIKQFLSQHAYAETFLRRLLAEGRALGKFPPSQIGFLKLLDRNLWFGLSDEGIPGAAFEAAGIRSHYELEKRTRMKHIFPDVEQLFSNIVGFKLPKDSNEYDSIPVPQDHPYAEMYDYDPTIEYNEHLERLETDTEYRLQQTLVMDKYNKKNGS